MRFPVVQFTNYLTDFRRTLLQTRYGLHIRNLLFVKPDKRLYFLDNLQAEYCLTHPAWANIQDPPALFPSEVQTVTILAGLALSALRAVTVAPDGKAYYADPASPAQVLGVTSQAISPDATGPAHISGELSDNAWAWTVGQSIYLGDNGTLTQTPPETGYLVILGYAETATKMIIRIFQPISLVQGV